MIYDRTELLHAIRDRINSADKTPAVIFNCHITGLAVARSLGRRGVPVIGLDSDPAGYGLSSRYTTVAGFCPYVLDDEPAFIDLLLEIGSALDRKAVLFPCLDEWVFAVSRHRARLEEFYILPFSELSVIERLLDKNLLYRTCQERGVPIPRTYYLEDQTPESIAAEIEFPCIVKPALQREFTNEFGEKVFRVESRDDFFRMCERAGHHPLLVQEIVGAGVDSFYSLCSYMGQDHQPGGVFVGRKLEQYPADFGTACLVDSRYVDSIAERGVQILKQFGYHGISEVEYIYDDRDREFKLLDINTRVWKWIGLPIAAGIDLPWLAYSDAVDGAIDPAPRQREDIRWTYLKDYIALRQKRAGAVEATLTRKDWLELIAGGQTDAGVVDAVYSHDDPEPFVSLIEGLFQQRPYYCAC